jgi:hypothetical protein
MADIPQARPTLLDPVGALLYYLAVRGAIEGGAYTVPSSRALAEQLTIIREKGKPARAEDPAVQDLWSDLWWMKEQKLLFDEHPPNPAIYWKQLSQHNVNARMHQFRPGFEHDGTRRQRYIVPREFVERAKTAARLVALKDLYRYNGFELPHPLLGEFLLKEGLVRNEEEFFTFLQAVSAIAYAEVTPTERLPRARADHTTFVEPAQTFRNQDRYVELRALDHFSTVIGAAVRRKRRIELQQSARRFAAAYASGTARQKPTKG